MKKFINNIILILNSYILSPMILLIIFVGLLCLIKGV